MFSKKLVPMTFSVPIYIILDHVFLTCIHKEALKK